MNNHHGLRSVCFGCFIGEFYPYLRYNETYPLWKSALTWLQNQTDGCSQWSFFCPRSTCQELDRPRHLGGGSYENLVSWFPPRNPHPSFLSERVSVSLRDSEAAGLPQGTDLRLCRLLCSLPTHLISAPSFHFLKMCLLRFRRVFFFRCLLSIMFFPSLVSSRISHTRQILKRSVKPDEVSKIFLNKTAVGDAKDEESLENRNSNKVAGNVLENLFESL